MVSTRVRRLFFVLCLAACDGAMHEPSLDESTLAEADARDIPSPGGTGPTTAGNVPVQPSPRERTYASGSILPTRDRHVLDAAVLDFYAAWKARYLVEGCGPGRIYADVSLDGPHGGGKAEGSITVSELHGFSMLATAQMADRDPDAHQLFDGLYAYYRAYPTPRSPYLMSWNQVRGCHDSPHGTTTATDGDLDIAYALLLASARWGDSGSIDYRAAAKSLIDAIRTHEMDPVTSLVLLGDFVVPGRGRFGQTTRTSDIMPDHFRAFELATGDPFWGGAVDAHWTLVADLQRRFAPATGLLSDFVIDIRTDPKPAPGTWLEHPTDQYFSWNACRTPWRLGTDWLISGDPRARAAVRRMNTWIRAKTGDDPRKIDGGYYLDGDALLPRLANETAFVASFGVAAMSDADNQAWLDGIWARVLETPIEADNYYGNSIKLLSMLVMSGRWAAP